MKVVEVLKQAEAFLFDFDGVVTDSEPYAFQTLCAVMKEHFGIIPDDEDIAFTIGLDAHGVAAALSRKYSIHLSGDELINLLSTYPDFYTEYEGIKPFSGIPQLFKLLRERGKKIAIVSSTRKAHLLSALKRMGLEDFPSLVIGGDSVEKRKPEAEPYLKAMRELGESCESALAIEDSPVGILAAKRAGLFVLAYKGSQVEQDTALADDTIRDYSELLELF